MSQKTDMVTAQKTDIVTSQKTGHCDVTEDRHCDVTERMTKKNQTCNRAKAVVEINVVQSLVKPINQPTKQECYRLLIQCCMMKVLTLYNATNVLISGTNTHTHTQTHLIHTTHTHNDRSTRNICESFSETKMLY